jgi:hypothetical protein
MRYIVLYASDCEACSKVARLVREVSVTGLEARGLADPQVQELLGRAARAAPGRPSLLIIDNDEVQLVSGLAMRRRLAGVIGWNRAGTLARLLGAEWRARLVRSAGSRAPSRRGVIGGALAGAAGWALTSGVASAATNHPALAGPALRPAGRADATTVMKTPAAQQAVRAFGAPDSAVLELTDGGQALLVLAHPGGKLTLIDNSPGALRGDPLGLTMGPAPSGGRELRFYATSGLPLADVTTSGDRVVATVAAQVASGEPGASAIEPDVSKPSKAQILVFVTCLQAQVTLNCADTCAACVHAPSLACIAQCGLCAGPNAWRCAKQAFGKPK